MNFLSTGLGGGGYGHRKDKGFSSKNKVQQYRSDGTESIIVMGRPFRVLQKIGDIPAPYVNRRQKHSEENGSYVFLVENSSRLAEFPRHLALKRAIFGIDQVAEAHKEIDVLSRVRDKNIVKVYHSEISRNEGKLGVSIAMEFCGNNLYRRIRSGSGTGSGTRLSESEICHVVLGMTSALGYLHSQQPPITHRDLRPENILINNNQTGPTAYKLCNFGNSTTEAYECVNREEASMAITDIEMHTNPAFRAPEMADPMSHRRICEKTDMWALGVLVYYMMHLKLPFEPTNMALSGNPKVRYPANSEGRYTSSLRVITDHLLDADPESRWDVFALTNFLRFDEDISRHLGTFCFTRTEYPEGWEEQDVKVLNRDPPKKKPPVTYGDEPGHDKVSKDGDGGRAGVGQAQRAASPPSSTTDGGRNKNLPAGVKDEAVLEAMMVLGGEPDADDPAMAEYRARIIREQEEAWAAAKAAAGLPNTPATPAAPPNAQENSEASADHPPQQQLAEPPKKKDLFDDLFAGPAEPTPAPTAASGPSTSGSPFPPQQSTAPVKDQFTADDLFSAPLPQQQQPYMASAQPGVYGGMNPAMAGPAGGFAVPGDGWGSGAPMMATGGMGYPGMMPQQEQHVGGGMPVMAPNTWGAVPGVGGAPAMGWGVSGPVNSGPAGYGGGMYGGGAPQSMPPPQQQQQQPLNQMNFLAPGPGQPQSGSPPQPQPSRPSPPPEAKKKEKDPFADLFS